jgi:murein L,D-transpeptidase YcbB/YkuD
MKRTYQFGILISAIFVTICGCNPSSTSRNIAEKSYAERIRDVMTISDNFIVKDDTLLTQKEIQIYYESTNYLPLWTNERSLTRAGEELYELITKALQYGLFPEMYHFSEFESAKDSVSARTELLLMNAYFLFSTHISVGCIDSTSKSYTWKADRIPFSFEKDLTQIKSENKAADLILSHQPHFWEYQMLQKGLAEYVLRTPEFDTIHFKIPTTKEDSLNSVQAAKKALLHYHEMDSSGVKSDSIFYEALRKFQRLNGLADDAIIGSWTKNALEKNNQERFLQAALALEKWRWKKAFPQKYFRVNVPEFNLYFVDSAKTGRKHKVIVGTSITPTPEFQATMRRIVANPYWHVPYSISSTEVLYNAKKDSMYFAKRGYRVFKGGVEQDPKTINWHAIPTNNFPYRIRQDAGPSNSLGLVKFLFPNEHSVFVHDTPGKWLFNNDIRAYSHGCIRVQDPFDLAKEVLLSDENLMLPDTLDSLILRGEQRVAELSTPFDVYIDYITTTADSSGQIIFHRDIYQRDDAYLRETFKKFTPVSHL